VNDGRVKGKHFVARMHAHPRSMGLKMDFSSLRYFELFWTCIHYSGPKEGPRVMPEFEWTIENDELYERMINVLGKARGDKEVIGG
jgi:hypothetical protein